MSDQFSLDNSDAFDSKRINRILYQIRLRAQSYGVISTVTKQEWVSVLIASRGHCSHCGKYVGFSAIAIDHIVPLSKGGSDTIENIVASCKSCNSKRCNHHDTGDRYVVYYNPNLPGPEMVYEYLSDIERIVAVIAIHNLKKGPKIDVQRIWMERYRRTRDGTQWTYARTLYKSEFTVEPLG